MVTPAETIPSGEDIPVWKVRQPAAPAPPGSFVVTLVGAFDTVSERPPIMEGVSWEPAARTWDEVYGSTPLDWSQTYTARLEGEVERARQAEIEQQLENLLGGSRDEVFQDGMNSLFADSMGHWMNRYGNEAVDVLASSSAAEQTGPTLLAEALISLGRLDDPRTQDSRLWLLADSLWHSSVQVRDAAGLGLAALGDRRAVRYLRRAVEKEPSEIVKRQLDRVASFLEP